MPKRTIKDYFIQQVASKRSCIVTDESALSSTTQETTTSLSADSPTILNHTKGKPTFSLHSIF